MGGVIKSITRPFTNAVSKIVGGVGSALGLAPKMPEVKTAPEVIPPAAAAAPVTPAAAAAPVTLGVTNQDVGGVASESALRKGKRGLTIKRTPVGGGGGLNV